MSIEKRKSMQHFEVTEDGTMFLKEKVEIIENDKVISWAWHRTCFAPIDETSEVPYKQFRDTALAVHTREIKEKFREKKRVKKNKIPKVKS